MLDVRVIINAQMRVCVFAAISGGKSEMFKSVGSRYKTKRHQCQMQYIQ